MKKIALLGCTGSIGKSTLKVISSDANLRVGLLVNNRDLSGLKALITKYKPDIAICVEAGYLYKDGKEYEIKNNPLESEEIYCDCDIAVNGIVGLAGLQPSLAVLRAGKILATANKEAFVCAGTLINGEKEKNNGVIYPLDSEHSAVWQLIDGKKDVKEIILTASGGAFRDKSKEELKSVKAEEALRHPNWIMGKKVTVDCATLLNKGMEIIEAKHLFGIRTTTLGHRESIVHALVKYLDGSFQASLSTPDMTTPISYALHYPECGKPLVEELDLAAKGTLNFFELDEKRFPCLKIARQASKEGDIAGCIMNAADEILVDRFIKGDIGFYDISDGIERALDKFSHCGNFDDSESVFRMDKEVREYTLSIGFGGKL